MCNVQQKTVLGFGVGGGGIGDGVLNFVFCILYICHMMCISALGFLMSKINKKDLKRTDSRCAFIMSFRHWSNQEPANQNQVLEFTVLE